MNKTVRKLSRSFDKRLSSLALKRFVVVGLVLIVGLCIHASVQRSESLKTVLDSAKNRSYALIRAGTEVGFLEAYSLAVGGADEGRGAEEEERHAKETEVNFDAFGAPIYPYPGGMRRKLIFCISTGHTGTVVLTELLACTHNTMAFHERQPSLNDFPSVMRLGKNATFEKRYENKIRAMEADLAVDKIVQFRNLGSTPEGVEVVPIFYAETSHMFIKSNADVIMKRFYDDPEYEISVIVLRRNIVDSLMSWLVLPRPPWNPNVGVMHYTGGEYTVYHRNFAILEPVKPYERTDTIDLALGFFADYELQTEAFFRQYPRVRRFDLRSEELFRLGTRTQELLSFLGLYAQPQALERLRRRGPINPHRLSKPDFFTSDEMPDAETLRRALLARVHRFMRDYQRAEIPLPDLPMTTMISCSTGEADSPGAESELCEVPPTSMLDDEIDALSAVNIKGNGVFGSK